MVIFLYHVCAYMYIPLTYTYIHYKKANKLTNNPQFAEESGTEPGENGQCRVCARPPVSGIARSKSYLKLQIRLLFQMA